MDSFPIEHLLAKSKYASLTFNYYNLVGSCEGNEPLKEPISVIAQVHGKTLKEVFDNQNLLNVFPKNHLVRHKFIYILLQTYFYKQDIPQTVTQNDAFYSDVKIDKKKIKSITFVWSNEKCCDANKEDKLIYLLPLSNESLDKLKQHLFANEQVKFFSIEEEKGEFYFVKVFFLKDFLMSIHS